MKTAIGLLREELAARTARGAGAGAEAIKELRQAIQILEAAAPISELSMALEALLVEHDPPAEVGVPAIDR